MSLQSPLPALGTLALEPCYIGARTFFLFSVNAQIGLYDFSFIENAINFFYFTDFSILSCFFQHTLKNKNRVTA